MHVEKEKEKNYEDEGDEWTIRILVLEIWGANLVPIVRTDSYY